MVALYTANSRLIAQLRDQITKQVESLRDARGDRRATAWHEAKIRELQREINQLHERD